MMAGSPLALSPMPSLDSLVSLAVLPDIFPPWLKLWKDRWYLFLDGCIFKTRLTHIKKKKKKSYDPFLTNSTSSDYLGLPRWLSGKKSACQFRRCEFNPWVRKIPSMRKQQTTPIFLLGKSLRQRNLVGHMESQRVKHELATKWYIGSGYLLQMGSRAASSLRVWSLQLRPQWKSQFCHLFCVTEQWWR